MFTQPKKWIGRAPTKCQICNSVILADFVDGYCMLYGCWGIMCPDCHERHGIGFGIGKGQGYGLANGEWLKTSI